MGTIKSKNNRAWAFFAIKFVDLLAIAGIVFAYIQFKDAKDILKQMPTKYINQFPGSIPKINEEIDKATSSLDIIVDYPIYGIFSAPDTSEKYKSIILSKAADKNCHVHLMTYDYKTRKKEFFRQFDLKPELVDDTNYFRKKYYTHQNPDNDIEKCSAHKLERFLRKHKIEQKPQTLNELFTVLNTYHTNFINDLNRPNVEIDSLSNPYSYNFWLVDKEVLVFSLTTLGKESIEKTYITHDPKIIEFVTYILDHKSN